MRLREIPLRGAKKAVVTHKRERVSLVGPSVAAAMKVHVTELLIGNEPSEPAHDTVVEVRVVFIRHGGDHVEVPSDEPRTDAGGAHVLEISEKVELCMVVLWAIHTS